MEATEKQIELFKEIRDRGCCKRCALRYLGFCKTLITFDYPNTTLVNLGLVPPEEEFEIGPPTKVKKSNPCTVCLGLLEDSMIEQVFTHEDLQKVAEYTHETFVIYISFSPCILVRDHSMQIHLKNKFPDIFNVEIQLNQFWRLSVEEKLNKILRKTYNHHQTKLTLHYHTDYSLENEELAFIQNYERGSEIQYPISRHYITNFLKTVSDEEFKRLVRVPPRQPFYSVTLKELKYYSETLHLIGNYCKYSRDLPQLRYGTNNKLRNEKSVESIILDAFRTVLGGFRELTFKVSSDDQGARILGKGRSFYLQLFDPKFHTITDSDYKQIEGIIKKTNLLKVSDLREGERRDIISILDAEELNPPSYKVLCIVIGQKNINHCVNAINMYNFSAVNQRTPLRTIHQREVGKKRKKIYHLRAAKAGDNLIEMDVCAQSGLQILEFVNGDMGRTTPSISEVVGVKVEMLAVDVVNFETTLACAADEEEILI